MKKEKKPNSGNIQTGAGITFQNIKDKLKIYNGKFFGKLQFLGKAMVFPIVILPLAAFFLRIGSLMTDVTLPGIEQGNAIYYIGGVLMQLGNPIFGNLPIIFSIGMAFGLSKDNRGEAALAGAIAAWVLAALLSEGALASLMWNKVQVYTSNTALDPFNAISGKSLLLYTVKNDAPFYALDLGVFGGIIAGCLTAWMYNRFSEIRLHTSLSFFEGRRFILILAVIVMIPVAIIFAVIWPWIQLGLTNVGLWAIQAGWIGTLIYTFLKTVLVLFGLHQVINTFLWFQLPITGEALFTQGGYIAGQIYTVNGDINAYMAGIMGSGVFLTGSFPEIIGGYWGISIAIILAAKKENRKEVMALMLSICVVSSLTGVGEPLILPIWYAAPILFFFQAIINAIFGSIAVAMGIRMGFGFSAGWIDYSVSFYTSWKMAMVSGSIWANPLWLIVLGAINGGVFFVLFYFTIIKMKLKTMGREDDNMEIKPILKETERNKADYITAKEIAKIVGYDNVTNIANCATRLRLNVKDNKDIDISMFKALGLHGAKKIGNESIQIIIGSGVESITNNFIKIIEDGPTADIKDKEELTDEKTS